ncbi:MAG: gluconate 2-dehydrogenase subunit 3 family protein [Candidatus Dormibacteraceae bacterium]
MAGSLVLGSRSIAGTSLASSVLPAQDAIGASQASLTEGEQATLGAAMAVIIPAGDGMPSAADVGGVEYLTERAQEMPELRKNLKQATAALGEISHARFKTSFESLTKARKVQVLKEVEKGKSPKPFATLRDFTYEAYYTRPEVWRLIGYDFHHTNDGGPVMKPFDEDILSEVRKKQKHYREA